MSEPDFPPELVKRCRHAAFGRNCPDVVRAVLRESGHAEVVAALKKAKDFVTHWSSPSAGETIREVDNALRKAGAL